MKCFFFIFIFINCMIIIKKNHYIFMSVIISQNVKSCEKSDLIMHSFIFAFSDIYKKRRTNVMSISISIANFNVICSHINLILSNLF